jgi:hypothetical protein
MKNNVTFDEPGILCDGLFNEHLSDIVIEIEGLKLKAMRNDIEGINDHLVRINNFILGIMETQLVLAEKSRNHLN